MSIIGCVRGDTRSVDYSSFGAETAKGLSVSTLSSSVSLLLGIAQTVLLLQLGASPIQISKFSTNSLPVKPNRLLTWLNFCVGMGPVRLARL